MIFKKWDKKGFLLRHDAIFFKLRNLEKKVDSEKIVLFSWKWKLVQKCELHTSERPKAIDLTKKCTYWTETIIPFHRVTIAKNTTLLFIHEFLQKKIETSHTYTYRNESVLFDYTNTQTHANEKLTHFYF